jgi:ABC-type maltose transport system permease subunit
MLWKLFQICIFLSVMFTGVYYEWTPNSFVLSMLSFIVTLLATVFTGWALQSLRSVLQKRARDHLPNRRRVF